MPNVISFFSDYKCENTILMPNVGVAGVRGYYANLSNWVNYTPSGMPPMYRAYVRDDTNFRDIFYGAIPNDILPAFSFPTSPIFDNNPKINDGKQTGQTNNFCNAFFIASDKKQLQTNYDCSYYLRIYATNYDGTHASGQLQIGTYLQSPYNGNRNTWNYNTNSTDNFYVSFPFSRDNFQTSQYTSIKMYKIIISDKEFFLFLLGVSTESIAPPANSGQNATACLISTDYFKVNIPKPYIGPVSKDSANSSFIPDRGLIHDNIASRDLTGIKNPYGFNSGALKLCKLTNTAYGLLCAQIFNGSSGSILNQISQDIAALTGGNEHRNHEEVQAIQAGIMKIHLIPDITTIPTGTGYNISTIAGYKISGLVPVPAVPITDSMLVFTTPSVRILRTWKSYIDYEPYTTITLRIPYVGNINIPPSIIYDNAVSLTYHLDLFSGTLSVDIIIHDYINGNSYIFSTLQANCAVSLPIAGTAAAGAPLLKIASGLLGVAMSGVGTSANNIFSVISGLQDTKKSVPFGNFAQSNISAYFDSRHCYAIIQSVNPSNADTFLADKGYVAHLSGIVNDFAGAGTEMHCRFESVDLTGLSKLTEREKQEVESMLKAGVHIRKV